METTLISPIKEVQQTAAFFPPPSPSSTAATANAADDSPPSSSSAFQSIRIKHEGQGKVASSSRSLTFLRSSAEVTKKNRFVKISGVKDNKGALRVAHFRVYKTKMNQKVEIYSVAITPDTKWTTGVDPSVQFSFKFDHRPEIYLLDGNAPLLESWTIYLNSCVAQLTTYAAFTQASGGSSLVNNNNIDLSTAPPRNLNESIILSTSFSDSFLHGGGESLDVSFNNNISSSNISSSSSSSSSRGRNTLSVASSMGSVGAHPEPVRRIQKQSRHSPSLSSSELDAIFTAATTAKLNSPINDGNIKALSMLSCNVSNSIGDSGSIGSNLDRVEGVRSRDNPLSSSAAFNNDTMLSSFPSSSSSSSSFSSSSSSPSSSYSSLIVAPTAAGSTKVHVFGEEGPVPRVNKEGGAGAFQAVVSLCAPPALGKQRAPPAVIPTLTVSTSTRAPTDATASVLSTPLPLPRWGDPRDLHNSNNNNDNRNGSIADAANLSMSMVSMTGPNSPRLSASFAEDFEPDAENLMEMPQSHMKESLSPPLVVAAITTAAMIASTKIEEGRDEPNTTFYNEETAHNHSEFLLSREIRALMTMNEQLNDALEMQEELRNQEQEDFMNQLSVMRCGLDEADGVRGALESLNYTLKDEKCALEQTLSSANEALESITLASDEYAENSRQLAQRVEQLSAYITDSEERVARGDESRVILKLKEGLNVSAEIISQLKTQLLEANEETSSLRIETTNLSKETISKSEEITNLSVSKDTLQQTCMRLLEQIASAKREHALIQTQSETERAREKEESNLIRGALEAEKRLLSGCNEELHQVVRNNTKSTTLLEELSKQQQERIEEINAQLSESNKLVAQLRHNSAHAEGLAKSLATATDRCQLLEAEVVSAQARLVLSEEKCATIQTLEEIIVARDETARTLKRQSSAENVHLVKYLFVCLFFSLEIFV